MKPSLPLQNPSLKLTSFIIHLLTVALSMAAAYFMTIQSLKIDLNAKAETEVVSMLDKKLSSLELLLRESVVTKEQFYQFSREIDRRLARIEYHLTGESGEHRGEK